MYYLVYEKNYLPGGDVDCVEEDEFALFSNRRDAVAEILRRKDEYVKNPDMGFIESESLMDEENGGYCLVIATGIGRDPSIRDGEIHLCMKNLIEPSMEEMIKKAVFLKQEYTRNLEIIDFDGEQSVRRDEDGEIDYDEYEHDWWLIEDSVTQTNGWPKIFLGIVEGETGDDILAKAAERFNMPAEALELMDV